MLQRMASKPQKNYLRSVRTEATNCFYKYSISRTFHLAKCILFSKWEQIIQGVIQNHYVELYQRWTELLESWEIWSKETSVKRIISKNVFPARPAEENGNPDTQKTSVEKVFLLHSATSFRYTTDLLFINKFISNTTPFDLPNRKVS